MRRATTHRLRRRRVGTQRGGVRNDPAARKRGRNANNDNNGGPPPGPPQPPAAPDSAFERALDASPLDINLAQLDALIALLDAEVWRTHVSADVLVKAIRRNPNLLCKRTGGFRYDDTPEQRDEMFKAVTVMATAPGPTGTGWSHLDQLLDATGNNQEKIGRDPLTGDTPLHVVVQRGPLWSVPVLLRHGADLWVNNRQGQSPMQLALASPHKVAFLITCLDSDRLQGNGDFRKVLQAVPANQVVELVNNRHMLLAIMRGADKTGPTISNVLQYVTPETLANERILNWAARHLWCEWVVALLDSGMSANETYANTEFLPLERFVQGIQLFGEMNNSDEPDVTLTPGFKTALQRLVESTSVEGVQSVLTAGHENLPAHVLEALEARVSPKPKWEGWTKGDAEAFDQVFEPEHALNFTACPVCLSSVDRIDACNYMGHNCKAQPGFYHKRLYETYQEQGVVHWCTNCGRIATASHQHYALESAGAKRRPLTFPSVDPFGHQCYPDGGGDLPEKVARFRRLREFALEMQEDVGKITEQEAKEQLVEEMWNAPLARSKIALRVAKDKAWNIPSDKFPTRKAAAVEAVEASGPAPDVRKPASDAALTPVRVLQALNAWSREEVAEGVQFVHRKTDGTVNAHEGDVIGVESLAEVLQARLAARGAPEFGFCWGYPACSARLYPEDVQPFVPVDLYEAYRAKFNDKFRGATGGGKRRGTMRTSHHHRGGGGLRVTSDAEGGLLQPLVDGQCALPNAQGGGGRAKGRRRQVRHTRRTVRL